MGWDDWKWTDEGRATVVKNGVSFAEVTDVLYAERTNMRLRGKSMQVRAAIADSGRPIMVVLTDDDRIGIWKIVYARVMTPGEWANL